RKFTPMSGSREQCGRDTSSRLVVRTTHHQGKLNWTGRREMGPTMAECSLTSLLHERAARQPDVTAYTYIDYEVDPNGFAERLTWAQVHHRAQVIAEELRVCG